MVSSYGELSAEYNSEKILTSVTVETGLYLVLGYVDANKEVSLMSAKLSTEPASLSYMLPITRTTGKYGGGVTTIGYCVVSEQTTIKLMSHCYDNSAYNLRGTLAVVKLGDQSNFIQN